MAQLDSLFRPRSIAVIGASNRPLTIGHRIVTNLLRYGFKGKVTPVNPKGEEILGLTAAKSILEVPHDVDMVHVIVKSTLVGPTLEDCARKGVKVAIINTSGFKEMGGEGIEAERQLVEIGKRTGMRLFGPNCQGVMNTDPEVSLYSNFTFAQMTPGHVSMVAQGGGVAEVINNYFGMNGVGQRMYASNGNACDITVPEIIEYYGDDPETRVIVLHAESFSDPEEFLRRVAPVAARKPILALKSGTTPEGARAASSHTGGLIEQDTVSDVLFDKAGVLRFASLGEMCEAAQAMSMQPVPRGNRLGLVTNAGSPAIIVTDEAVKSGLRVPDLCAAAKDLLREKLQAIASIHNPIDMAATASGVEFGHSLDALLADPDLDALVICFVTPFFVDTVSIARTIAEHATRTDKTLVAVAMTNPGEKPEWKETLDIVTKAGVPVYYFPEAAARVLFHMDRYRRLRDRPREAPFALAVDAAAVRKLLDAAPAGPDGFLAPRDVTTLLSRYGLPLVEERRAADADGLVAAAKALGFPVVLKAEAASLVHKTDAGGVALHLGDEAALRQAHADMARKLAGHAGLGFVVQRQAPRGLEVIVGGARAGRVGATVMFGLGGIHVEVLKDVVFKLAPLCPSEAVEMLGGIKARALLAGVRGQAAVDQGALADVLLRVSRLLADHPEIAELDLNPVIAYPDGAKVVDARVRVVRG